MKHILLSSLLLVNLHYLNAQSTSKRDSLQGGLREERTCYDVMRYNLDIIINPSDKSIKGSNEIVFKVDDETTRIQVDLFENMQIESIIWNNKKLKFQREYDAIFILFPKKLKKGSLEKILVNYWGNPLVAKNAPWDGGFVFNKDTKGNPWIGVAVQGTGASLWYPCKDSQTDEPDQGASIKVAVPNGLMNVSNGRFKGSTDLKNGYTRWDWEVKNPINNYDITVNIADYIHIHDNHQGLDLDFYVLRENEEKAKKHFEQDVKPMMDCFQSKFGKYPFWEDGYKLVETPYLGMEHQSAVAYGNKYKKGYMGYDISGTGAGLFFDYITIHETGHEWFGNSITSKDIADMWIHEGFTTYTESVFIECLKGYEEAQKYINGQSRSVRNDRPVIGQFGVNKEGSGDMYYKGALMLNTIRHIINDDTLWWKLLYTYAETYKKQIIDTPTVLAFFNKETGLDFTKVFEQYLTTTKIPKLVLDKQGKTLKFYWENCVDQFNMPVAIMIKGKEIRLQPTTNSQELTIDENTSWNDIEVATKRFFVKVKKLNE
ncbi:M1 family metallopeptidase [Flavobacterium sp.]|uniref:M1 family metallopeptidase n=1 Tax=Flavobacterium sp. TaxID=239 RepID=UPI0025BED10E|nr:M1 family metallopeptidase [Flavobacterium sp.]